MEKLKLQTQDLQDSLDRLAEAIEEENDEDNYIRDSTILRFQLSWELCWKFMREFNMLMGQPDCYSPKPCIRAAAQNGLIDDPEQWFKYLEYRNLVVHTYNQATADRLYEEIANFLADAKKLLIRAVEKIPKV